MRNGLPGNSIVYQPWLICLLVGLLTGCAIDDLPKRKFDDCTLPTALIGSAAVLLDVNFSLESTTGVTGAVNWDFGDGGTAQTAPTRHTFATPGTYKIRATLTNKCGDMKTISKDIIVDNTVIPIVTTQGYQDVTLSMATLRMAVASNGNGKITRYGFCYSDTEGIPNLYNALIVGTDGDIAVGTPASFSVGQLKTGTPYYVRGFATNNAGTGYGSIVTVVTATPPALTTAGDTVMSSTSAVVVVKLLNRGDPAATRYGICYSASSTVPTLNMSGTLTTDISNLTDFTAGTPTRLALTNLLPNTKYYYRAYATSTIGTVYSTNANTPTFTTPPEVDLTTGLIGDYSFTGNGLDASGSKNHGTLMPGAGYGTDRKGNANAALQLDGVSGYFDIPDAPSLRPANLSVSIWVKPAALTHIMQIYNKSKFSDGTGEQYSSLMKPAESGTLLTINADVKKGSNCEVSKGWQTVKYDRDLSLNLPLNTWHHLVSVFDGGTARVFFDGILLGSQSVPAAGIDNCPGGSLKFGAQYTNFENYFNGAIDDVRIYNRALTDAQIQALYTQ